MALLLLRVTVKEGLCQIEEIQRSFSLTLLPDLISDSLELMCEYVNIISVN